MTETLKEKTTKGIFWGAMSNITLQLVGVVFGIMLGRILSDEDYGMMAMIAIFQLVAIALQNSGFTVAITNMKSPTHDDYNAVFWFNILVGGTLYILLFLSAPLIASFYDTPALTSLCRYSFLGILFASFGTAQSAWLFKNLHAKQQAKANIVAVLLSSITGVLMAWGGFRYWSLATQSLVYILLCTLLYWHYSPWRPSVHHISFAPVRRMFKFSFKILLTTLITHVNNNVLNILLGRFYTRHDVGQYNQAYQWDSKGFQLVQSMVNQVAQPVLVELKSEADRQLHAFRKMMRFSAFISFPLLLGLGLVSREFIVLTITEKWLPSAQLLRLLCVSGAIFPLITLMSNLIISKGKANVYLGCTVALGVLQIVLMLLLWPYGIRNMVIAYVCLNVSWLFVWFYFVRKSTGYTLPQFFKDVLPFAVSASGVMIVTYYATLSITHLLPLLVVRVVMAAVLYYVIMRVAKAEILRECQAAILSKWKKKH